MQLMARLGASSKHSEFDLPQFYEFILVGSEWYETYYAEVPSWTDVDENSLTLEIH
jgi:hypothetical protein